MLSRTKLVAALITGLIASASSPALAALTIVEGIPDGKGNFYFYDSRLDSGDTGFAMLGDGGYYVGYGIQTYINPDNSFLIKDSYEYAYLGAQAYTKRTSYSKYGTTPDFEAIEGIGCYGPPTWPTCYNYFTYTEYYETGQTKVFENIYDSIYSYTEYSENGEIVFQSSSSNNISSDDLNARKKEVFSVHVIGIFDFDNSFITYSDGSIFPLSAFTPWSGTGMYFVYHFEVIDGNITYFNLPSSSYYVHGSVTGITLALNLPIPEPETWAMAAGRAWHCGCSRA